MQNIALLQLLERARANPLNPYLDVSTVLRYQPTQLETDLKCLHHALWTMPFITVLRIFPTYYVMPESEHPLVQYQLRVTVANNQLKYRVLGVDAREKQGEIAVEQLGVEPATGLRLTAQHAFEYVDRILEITASRADTIQMSPAVLTLVRKILRSHPNLRSLEIRPGCPLFENDIATELAANFAYFASSEAPRYQDCYQTKIVNWLKRKAVHAIMGERMDEIQIIFNSEDAGKNYLEAVIEELVEMRKQLKYQLEKAIINFLHIQMSTPQRVATVEQYYHTIRQSFEYRIHELGQKIEIFEQEKNLLQVVRETKRVDLLSFVRSKLGNAVADWLIRQLEEAEHRDALSKNLVLSPNSLLTAELAEDPLSVAPLQLAWRFSKINVFEALLQVGANPITNQEMFELIFSPLPDKRCFRQAVLNHLQQVMLPQWHQRVIVEPSLPVEYQAQLTPCQFTAMSRMMIAALEYVVHGLPLRLDQSRLARFFSVATFKDQLQRFTATALEHRVAQVYGIIATVLNPHSTHATIADKLTQQMSGYRTGIFNARNPQHLFTVVRSACHEYERATLDAQAQRNIETRQLETLAAAANVS